MSAVVLSFLYIQWFAYMDGVCKECLWVKYVLVRTKIHCIRLGNRGLVNVLNVNSAPIKYIQYENKTPVFFY